MASLDAAFLHALCAELAAETAGARVERIHQPEKDKIVLSLHTQTEKKRLLICTSPSGARIHLTQEDYENPSEPPSFCMLLRKHLSGARIASIEQPDFERVLLIRFSSFDEMHFESSRLLAVELIGRSANLILVGEDGRIVDAIRRLDYSEEGRGILPGMLYRLPERQNKMPFYSVDRGEMESAVRSIDDLAGSDRALLARFSGLSPLVCRELLFRSGGTKDGLVCECLALRDLVEKGMTAPFRIDREGLPFDFSFMPVMQYGSGAEITRFDTFSALLDSFYAQKDRRESRQRRMRQLYREVRTVRERLARKLEVQRGELAETEGREEIRRQAELITANLYRIKKGERELQCENYYLPDSPETVIPLDPLKSPQQNAAQLFRKYERLKSANKILAPLIAEGEKKLDYLDSVLNEIGLAVNSGDLDEIRCELAQTGILKEKRGKRKQGRVKNTPLRFRSSDGLEILVGRNNLQNDALTFTIARRTDLWLHVKDYHGSHVILRTNGCEPPGSSIRDAASLAVFYSAAREAQKAAVDYTQVRFVRKPSGALPGSVLYSDFSTVVVQTSDSLVQRLTDE